MNKISKIGIIIMVILTFVGLFLAVIKCFEDAIERFEEDWNSDGCDFSNYTSGGCERYYR